MHGRGRTGRRPVLAALAGGLTACVGVSRAAPAPAPVPAAPPAPAVAVPAALEAPAPESPAVVEAPPPAPPPVPVVSALGVDGITQPLWAGDGSRVLFYDQPAPGLGGTWSVDPDGGNARLERPEWGNYVARGTLLAIPRPSRRDTWVLHLPSGREWTLPASGNALFSPDGTVVAFNAATTQPGGAGGGGSFQTTTLTVAGADGQDPRRIALPISGSAVAWLPGRDGAPNGRLLLSGRRSRPDHPALWLLDVRDRVPNVSSALHDLTRSRRLNGILVSPDGQWVAYMAMWNADPGLDGLWVMRTDGSDRRRLDLLGSYRWTADGRLLVIPVRAAPGDSHELWEVMPETGAARRLTDPAETPFRVSNYDWDVSPDGTKLVFVSAETRQLAILSLPAGLVARDDVAPPVPAAPGAASGGKPYRLPFALPPGPSAWYIAHWYGVTTGGYRGRNSVYSQGQGIHFGIDFPAPMGTPVVALAPGRVIAIDGDYGSPPHNVVVQLFDGNQAVYGHLVERSRHVQVGQTVEPGQVVGNTGDSSAPYDGNGNPHIHLEIRKGGRAIATNPVPYFDVNWDDLSLGVYPGPRFEKDLDNPRRHQFLDDQPDIRFGGPIITNFARAWPP